MSSSKLFVDSFVKGSHMASSSHGTLDGMSAHVVVVGGGVMTGYSSMLDWLTAHTQRVHAERQSWRSEFTPLPGVSAPAGLSPWPQVLQFAAAQRSLCPVPADNGTLAWCSSKECMMSHHTNHSLLTHSHTQKKIESDVKHLTKVAQ